MLKRSTTILAACAALLILARPLAAAEEAKPESKAVESLVQLLEKIQSDPAAAAALEDSLKKQIEELRKSLGEPSPAGDLPNQIEKAKAELGELEKQLPELTKRLEEGKQKQAKADRDLELLQRSLELLKSISPSETAPAKPQDKVQDKPAEAKKPAISSKPLAAAPPDPSAAPISFNRQIRPILLNHCGSCHGQDPKARKASLQLDDPESALKALKSGHTPIVPGDRAKSELVRRITTTDDAERMPPKSANKPLTEEQVTLLARWIDQGAKFEKHWAFVAPTRPEAPKVKNAAWAKTDIDRFILSHLESEGLSPNPEADRRTLIRRATFDLTGLPPAPSDVEAFVADPAPDAYEKLVDRLMARPQYGEQMARHWLDAARYADTNGYHIDNERQMWIWRDWVINSFNRNEPFDQFTVEQIAGDLLPKATLEQRIGSGFNRNHMINFEGGAIPEEYRMNYIVDRVNTTGMVWLGLTVQCAQCHTHKFDPISDKEYYQLYAYFNSVPEEGLDGREGNSAPRILVPNPAEAMKLDDLRSGIANAERRLTGPNMDLDIAQQLWEKKWTERAKERWTVLNPVDFKSAGGATLRKLEDKSILAEGENPKAETYEFTAFASAEKITAIRLETLTHESLPEKGAGRAPNANFVLGEISAVALDASNPDMVEPIQFVAADADYSQKEFEIAKAIDGNPDTGWAVDGNTKKETRTAYFIPSKPFGFEKGTLVKISLKTGAKHADHSIGRFRLSVSDDPAMSISTLGAWSASGPFVAADGAAAYDAEFPPEKKIDLKETYEDGRLKWVPAPKMADGVPQELVGENSATYFYRVIDAPSARQMKLAVGTDDAVKIWLNGAVIHDKKVERGFKPDEDKLSVDLQPGENRLLVKVVNYKGGSAFQFAKTSEQTGEIPIDIELLLAAGLAKEEERKNEQIARLRDYFRQRNMPDYSKFNRQLTRLRKEEADFMKPIPTTMVMKEMEKPRETFILARGQYDQPTDKVEAGVPQFLPPLPKGAPNNRLGLAKWLVDPANPLPARVTVNRLWRQFFGEGIVKTAEDFGVQGEWPSHPELLDWLAVDFVESGWDVKRLVRMILASAAYRQTAVIRPEIKERDPENRLIARGPRFRMDAEMVRDTALSVGGLLVPKIGGPSVKPYQPPGLWEEVAYGGKEYTGQIFEQDKGEKLYRRSMYTFWKRQAPPPSMILFDAPNREICTVRRSRTNTPLQALALMNDPQFVEAARGLAQRMMTEAGAKPEERVAYAFQLATARKPSERECEILMGIFAKQLEKFRADTDGAVKLLSVGESKRDEKLDPAELAAWACVANMILNLDETVTKG